MNAESRVTSKIALDPLAIPVHSIQNARNTSGERGNKKNRKGYAQYHTPNYITEQPKPLRYFFARGA